MRRLPPGQTRILTLFAEAEHSGRQPSRSEIAERLSYAFPSAVSKHVEALVRKGFMILDKGKKRNVRLSESGWQAIGLSPVRPVLSTTATPPQRAGVPVLGTIAAGTPIEAIEDVDSVLRDLSPLPGRFALRVRGDSMINAGINDGDYAIIQQGGMVADNSIGAVVIAGEATLKRVVRHPRGIELIAENPNYAPRVILGEQAKDVQVIGPLLFVYRIVR